MPFDGMSMEPEKYFESLKGVMTDSYHPERYVTQVARDVLAVDLMHHRTFEKAVPMWRWPLWGVAFEELTAKEDSQWKRDRIFGDDWHRQSPPSYSMVQTGVNKERAIINDGGAVIAYEQDGKAHKFVLDIAPQPFAGVVLLRAIAANDQQGKIEEFFSNINEWIGKNNFYKGQKLDASGKFLNLSDVTEEDLILPADIKRELFRNVAQMVEKWEDYAKFGIPAKRGMILAGPPGNGKTLSCKVLAKKLDCTFIWVTPRHLQKMDGVSHIYEFARELAPTVVLLEDADVFGLDRRLGEFSPMLGELLNNLDGFEENKGVITIMSSNYAEMLDSALTQRPGRFDTKLLVTAPGREEAHKLILRTLQKRQLVFNGDPGMLMAAAQQLSEVRASGAYVVEMVNYASMLAVERGRGDGSRLRIDAADVKDSVERIAASLQFNDHTEKAVINENVFKWGGWSREVYYGGQQ
jgi:DNA polymerase III delta prime subunit